MADVPSYCLNLVCPWASMYWLMDILAHGPPEENESSPVCGPLTLVNSMQSALTCTVPCWMVCAETVREEVLPEEDDGYGNFLPFMGNSEMRAEEAMHLPLLQPPAYSETATACMACMGALCLLPTLYGLRYNVDKKCHFRRESPWETALITCCAWPCSLTQMRYEMLSYYD